jgi:hypothetical protein
VLPASSLFTLRRRTQPPAQSAAAGSTSRTAPTVAQQMVRYVPSTPDYGKITRTKHPELTSPWL